jgi:hypothetical protein
MPRIQDLENYENARIKAAVERADRKMEKVVLPEDFTGQIFIKCRDEAARIRNRIAFLDGERKHIRERIKALENEARSMMPHIIRTKTTGDVLSKFKLTSFDSGGRVLTEKVLAFRTNKIEPLRREENRLEHEIFIRNQELGHLKRIASACGRGDVGLLCLLSDQWRNRLMIGGSILGKLPEPVRQLGERNTIFVDSTGNVLPGEALGANGKPDLPSGKNPQMPGHGYSRRGDHEGLLPGQPKTTDEWEKPR